ncbi:hypothetical protein KVL66_03890 [Helicobacter pylori]|uniref:hypothetical protein n=1 Tax=Helicobacter pylori TaxID=210 RepID=UPI000EAD8C30|nr:hypothetical protein [Helicobacter pylori]RKV33811.1 hypothetical protein DD750_03975 [Helicobacter pylori]WQY03339.1 hypothetical protein KVL66_03890 [Helicobacter pylori]
MKSIKKPHLDHTQALASYVSGSLGTLKVFLVWVRKLFSNPCLDNISTKILNNRKSELVLKTMFKSNGDYKNNNAYKSFQVPDSMLTQRFSHRSSSHGGAKKNNT